MDRSRMPSFTSRRTGEKKGHATGMYVMLHTPVIHHDGDGTDADAPSRRQARSSAFAQRIEGGLARHASDVGIL